MRLKEKISESTTPKQPAKLLVLTRKKKGGGRRVVTQELLKRAYHAAQLEAHLQNVLRTMLEKSADIEPGRYIVTGNVFRCEACGRFWVEDGRAFWVSDYESMMAEDGVGARASGPVNGYLPTRECPWCLAVEVIGGGGAA